MVKSCDKIDAQKYLYLVMRTLELFKGGGSFSNWSDNRGYETITVDILEKWKPTHCVDIMEFDYKQYPVGYFDIIFCSPECKIYSVLQYTWIGRKWKDRQQLIDERKKHDKFFHKTIEIINYLKPKYYVIENPKVSAIWEIEFDNNLLSDINYICLDYCRFGYAYRKQTKFLTNIKKNDMRCKCKGHSINLGISGKEALRRGVSVDNLSIKERYSIPQDLFNYLFDNLLV